MLLSLSGHLSQGNLDHLAYDLECIPWYFRDTAEMFDDVYPILKIILKLNAKKNQYNLSLKNVLKFKLRKASVGKVSDSDYV